MGTLRQPVVTRWFIALCLLAGMACGPCNLLSKELPTPSHTVAVSTEAAGRLESRIQENLNGPSGQQFILRVTDAELTSLLVIELDKHSDSPIEDPTVWFTKGKIYATGRLVNVVPVETNFSLVASARIVEGKVVVGIEQLSAGAFPLPSSILGTLSESINQTVADMQLDVEVTALEVLEGEAIIQGIRK